jgi:hypothetical protein
MIHLQKFIERVQGAEARGLKDLSISVTDAKSMHADLTRLLLDMQKLRELLEQQAKPAGDDDTLTVEMNGGSF